MKRYAAFVIAVLMACTAIFFGVRSHRRKAAEMRAALDSALVQNRNYVAFTSDSLLKEVAAYFDRWGSANDRLRAHYVLGCAYRDLHDAPIALLTWEDAIAAADTTSADCDFVTLFRVYGQMASVYYRQFMPEKQLEAGNAFCKYVTKPGYKPYLVYILSREYLQNEIIADNRIYIADRTFIGSNVTSSQETGSVTIEKGKILIFNQSATNIPNDFEVKKGAILEIR